MCVCLRSTSSFSKSLSKPVNPAPAQTSGFSQHGNLKFEEAQLLIVRPKREGNNTHTHILGPFGNIWLPNSLAT